MKYYVIVGEASGDLHGSKLIDGIKSQDPSAQIRFWGGDRMVSSAGAENMVKHYKESSFMGFWEVLKNLKTILSQISLCKKDIMQYKPDVVILIDYAGFNLRIAKFAKCNNIKTFYYIAPKVWAWKESRVKKIRRYVDELFVIFPFEVEYFKERGVKAYYFGNPIMDAMQENKDKELSKEDFIKTNNLDNKPIIALLAGSRHAEIDYNLPFMVEVANHFPQYQFIIAAVAWLDKSRYDKCLTNSIGNIRYMCDKTYSILYHSQAAIVTSGTATLETALLNIPEVVCYWCNPISGFIGKILLKIKWVSLVNIVMNREVVKELIYKDMIVSSAVSELKAILPNGYKYSKMLEDFNSLRLLMGEAGASYRVASKMVELLKEDYSHR